MFCPNCGAKLDDDALFCGECGTKIAAPQAAATTAAPASQAPASSKPLVAFKIGNMDFSIVKEKIDFIGLIAAIVAFIALFLPYVTVSSNFMGMKDKASFNFFTGTTSNAIFIMIIILVYIAANLFGKKLASQISAYVLLAFVIITIIGINSEVSSIIDSYDYYGVFSDAIKVYPSIGFYLMLIASLVMSFLWLIRSKLLPLIKKQPAAQA